MTDKQTVMSWLEGLAQDGWPMFHSESEVRNTAKAALELLKLSEPVRHGHWIDKPTGKYGNWQSYCSACGKHSQIGGIESNRHKPRCPWCGCRMKEEE